VTARKESYREEEEEDRTIKEGGDCFTTKRRAVQFTIPETGKIRTGKKRIGGPVYDWKPNKGEQRPTKSARGREENGDVVKTVDGKAKRTSLGLCVCVGRDKKKRRSDRGGKGETTGPKSRKRGTTTLYKIDVYGRQFTKCPSRHIPRLRGESITYA